MQFWIYTVKTTILFEWGFIVLVLFSISKHNSIVSALKPYNFIMTIGLLWILSVSVSFLFSPYYSSTNPLALIRYFETISHILFFLSLWYAINYIKLHIPLLFLTHIVAIFIIFIYLLYILYFIPDIKITNYGISWETTNWTLNTQFRRIGYLLEVGIVFSFIFLKQHPYKTIILSSFLFSFLLSIGGRAALVGLFIVLIVSIYFLKKHITYTKLLKLFLVFIFSTSFFLYVDILNLHYASADIDRTIQSTSLNSLSSSRLDAWLLLINQLQDHWLIGGGPQSYFFYPNRGTIIIHAHNFILQFLGEWGIIGTLLFIRLLFFALRKSIRMHIAQAKNIYQFLAFMTIVALSITGLFGGTFFFPQTAIILIFSFTVITSNNLGAR